MPAAKYRVVGDLGVRVARDHVTVVKRRYVAMSAATSAVRPYSWRSADRRPDDCGVPVGAARPEAERERRSSPRAGMSDARAQLQVALRLPGPRNRRVCDQPIATSRGELLT